MFDRLNELVESTRPCSPEVKAIQSIRSGDSQDRVDGLNQMAISRYVQC